MSRANSKKEQKIIREADKLISMKENVDALSWSRVQEIADELRGCALSDQRREELARELISISQANISLSAKLGIFSEAPAVQAQQASSVLSGSSEYVSPKWKPEDAPQQQDSEFFHAQHNDDAAQASDIPAGENPLIIPRASVADSAVAVVDEPVKPGPTIEEVLADSSAATTHPMAPVPDDNPITSDPLINNAAADQLASGIDKMVDDLEQRYAQRQQEKDGKTVDEQPDASPADAVDQHQERKVEQELAAAQAKLNDVEIDTLLEQSVESSTQSDQKPEQAEIEVSDVDDKEESSKDEAASRENDSLDKSTKKKEKKRKRKEEKKARKAEKAARKAQKEAAAKAAKQQADELEKKLIQSEDGQEPASDSETVASVAEASIVETASIDMPASEDGASGSTASPATSNDGVPDPAATKDPEVTKVQGFATFKNVYSSRDARLSLFQDDDGHLVAVDNSKLV